MGTGLIMNSQGVHHEVKRSSSDNRRSNKPIMEKRRRARINNCLNDLKVLILDATKKDPARHSKLEKADILEKTVRYLTDMQRQQLHMAQAANPADVDKYLTGYTDCAKEVDRFPGIDPVTRRRLVQYLTSSLATKSTETSPASPTSTGNTNNEHRLPTSPPSSPDSKMPTISHPAQQQQQQQQQYQHPMTAAQVQQQSQTQYLSQAMVKPMLATAATATNANAYYFNYAAPQHAQQHMHIQQQPHHLSHQQQMPSLVPIPNRAPHTVSPITSNSTAAYPTHTMQSSAPTPPSSVSSPVSSTQYLPLSPVSFEFQHAKRSDSASRDVDDEEEEDDEDDEEEEEEDDERDADEDDEEELTVDVDDEYLQEPATRRRRLNCGSSSAVSSASSQVSQSSSSASSMSSADEDDQRSTCSTNSGPLSLVMKRSAAAMDEDEERPWRPW